MTTPDGDLNHRTRVRIFCGDEITHALKISRLDPFQEPLDMKICHICREDAVIVLRCVDCEYTDPDPVVFRSLNLQGSMIQCTLPRYDCEHSAQMLYHTHSRDGMLSQVPMHPSFPTITGITPGFDAEPPSP